MFKNYEKLKSILQRPEIQTALADNNLFEVYSFASMLSPDLTEFLYENNIDPFDYLEEVPNYMFKDWGSLDLTDLTVVCEEDSAAYNFAIAHDILFEIVGEEKIL